MAIKVPQKDGTYKYRCSFCNKVFNTHIEADSHRDDEHELVYVQMLKVDVARLLQFIATGERKLLTETMIKSLERYSR